MSKPIAVLISDIHFNIHTLELADAALLKAQFKAKMLKVPLVIAGDLLDTKAIIRAEVANRLIQMLSVKDAPETIILVGNHDLINEKGREHALNFLKPYAVIIDVPQVGHLCGTAVQMIPYMTDPSRVANILLDEEYPPPPLVIMHQGVQGSAMGDYVVDKSAVPKEVFAGLNVISGHYHPRQTIECPDGGMVQYIGNPYTLGFGEANDQEKGYQILHDDGGLEFVPTNLRKHVVIKGFIYDENLYEFDTVNKSSVNPHDIVCVKITGAADMLRLTDKRGVKKMLNFLPEDFKLDLIPLDQETQEPSKAETMTQGVLLDSMIDSLTNTEDATKTRLKELWRACASN